MDSLGINYMENDDKYCNVCSIINDHFMDEINVSHVSYKRLWGLCDSIRQTYLYEISNALWPQNAMPSLVQI